MIVDAPDAVTDNGSMELTHEPQLPRVFVIGLSRTGTTSLCQAAQLLGYLPAHNPNPDPFFEGDFSIFDTFDAGGDISVAAFYRELDEAYPGSRFVLSLREAEAWLSSVVIHFANLPRNSTMGTRGALRERVYGAAWPTAEQFLESYKRHITEVAAYFDGRPDDLLVMDVTRGESWGKLCPFLNREEPDAPFPRSNATTVQDATVARRAIAEGRTRGTGVLLDFSADAGVRGA